MKNIRSVFSLFVVGLSFFSCVNKDYDIKKTENARLVFDPMIGAPLLYSSDMTVDQTLMRYLGKEKVGADEDGLVYIRYENVSMNVNAANAITIPQPVPILPSQIIAFDNAGWAYAAGKSTIVKTVAYTFPFVNGEDIDSIAFNALLYNITALNSNFPVSGTTNTLTIRFPSLTKNGVAYSLPITVTSAAFTYTKSTPLEGYTLGLTANQFNVEYTLSLNGSLPTSGMLQIAHNFGSFNSTLDYKYIYGNLGQRVIFSSTQILPVQLFDDAQGMVFEDPRIVMTVKNSFGLPLQISLTNLVATSSTNALVPVTINGTDSLVNLAFPATVNDSGVVTTRTFNKDNSNIKNALNSQPKQFSYTIRAKTNPTGVTAPARPFLKSDSKAEINLDVIFPLWGSCTKYGTNDDFGFDYGELFGNATGIEFKIWINNGLPAGGKLTMIFLDSAKVEVDRIAEDLTIIDPAPVANGLSTGISEHNFTLKYYKLENLPKIKHCRVSTDFHSPYINGTDASGGVQTVKVMKENTMQIKVGMKVKMEFKVGGN